MTSKAIICASAAASFSFVSLSFADNDDRRGPRYGESSRAEQRGPMMRAATGTMVPWVRNTIVAATFHGNTATASMW